MIILNYDEKSNKFTMTDGDKTIELTKTAIDPKTKKVKLALPENSANRKWQDLETLQSLKEVKLDYKETRVLGSTPSKKVMVEYLSDEDRKLYEEILERAMKAREAEKEKAKDPIEKAKRLAEKYQREYEKLLSQKENNEEV